MKLVALFVSSLALAAGAQGACAAEASPAPSYSATFSAPVNRLVGCYTNGQTLMTATPTGDGFVVRRKGDASILVLSDHGVRSRAELYRSADGPGRPMRQVLRLCDRYALSSTGSFSD